MHKTSKQEVMYADVKPYNVFLCAYGIYKYTIYTWKYKINYNSASLLLDSRVFNLPSMIAETTGTGESEEIPVSCLMFAFIIAFEGLETIKQKTGWKP